MEKAADCPRELSPTLFSFQSRPHSWTSLCLACFHVLVENPTAPLRFGGMSLAARAAQRNWTVKQIRSRTAKVLFPPGAAARLMLFNTHVISLRQRSFSLRPRCAAQRTQKVPWQAPLRAVRSSRFRCRSRRITCDGGRESGILSHLSSLRILGMRSGSVATVHSSFSPPGLDDDALEEDSTSAPP